MANMGRKSISHDACSKMFEQDIKLLWFSRLVSKTTRKQKRNFQYIYLIFMAMCKRLLRTVLRLMECIVLSASNWEDLVSWLELFDSFKRRYFSFSNNSYWISILNVAECETRIPFPSFLISPWEFRAAAEQSETYSTNKNSFHKFTRNRENLRKSSIVIHPVASSLCGAVFI